MIEWQNELLELINYELDEIDLWIDKVALSWIIILVYELAPAHYKVFSVTLKQNKRSPESENKKKTNSSDAGHQTAVNLLIQR